MLDPTQEQKLIQAALAARQQAYAPYSKFLVGAALLTPSGQVHSGCNVENASYGLAICAERSAVSSMIVAGERQIQAIAVASQGGVTPCGACRQVLIEFGDEVEVLGIDTSNQDLLRWSLRELLPGAFRLNNESRS